jgi:hypothetical protein
VILADHTMLSVSGVAERLAFREPARIAPFFPLFVDFLDGPRGFRSLPVAVFKACLTSAPILPHNCHTVKTFVAEF